MESLVNQQNFFLGCRVCRQMLKKNNSVFFADFIPDLTMKYSEAFQEITDLDVTQADGLPQRLCSDCAAKLTIAYQFRKDAFESDKVLQGYSEMEKSENDIYENAKFEEEYLEYETLQETIEEMDESSQDSKKEIYEEIHVNAGSSGTNDAVSFLTEILKPGSEPTVKVIESKKIITKKISNTNFDDPNRRHVCNVCNKKFIKRSNLIDHLRLHANVKVFSCEYCEKSFVQAGNYKAHVRTHTKEKPYSCQYCNKSYSQSSSLKIHIRSHTQEKNYICETCNKAFTNASDLGKHKLIHDPFKRFKCEECQRDFTQKIHLRKHMEKHHADSVYEYDVKAEPIGDDTKVIFEHEYEVDESNDVEVTDIV